MNFSPTSGHGRTVRYLSSRASHGFGEPPPTPTGHQDAWMQSVRVDWKPWSGRGREGQRKGEKWPRGQRGLAMRAVSARPGASPGRERVRERAPASFSPRRDVDTGLSSSYFGTAPVSVVLLLGCRTESAGSIRSCRRPTGAIAERAIPPNRGHAGCGDLLHRVSQAVQSFYQELSEYHRTTARAPQIMDAGRRRKGHCQPRTRSFRPASPSSAAVWTGRTPRWRPCERMFAGLFGPARPKGAVAAIRPSIPVWRLPDGRGSVLHRCGATFSHRGTAPHRS
jgi:hypothetical protein